MLPLALRLNFIPSYARYKKLNHLAGESPQADEGHNYINI